MHPLIIEPTQNVDIQLVDWDFDGVKAKIGFISNAVEVTLSGVTEVQLTLEDQYKQTLGVIARPLSYIEKYKPEVGGIYVSLATGEDRYLDKSNIFATLFQAQLNLS